MDRDRIVGTAKEFAGKAESAVGDLAGDRARQAQGGAREAAGVVQNAFGVAKDAARDAARSAGGKAADIANDANDAVKDALHSGAALARDSGERIADAVSQRPAQTALVAGLIGFALGVILTRSSRPPRSRWDYRRYYGS